MNDELKKSSLSRTVAEVLASYSPTCKDSSEIQPSDVIEETLNIDSLSFINVIIDLEAILHISLDGNQELYRRTITYTELCQTISDVVIQTNK